MSFWPFCCKKPQAAAISLGGQAEYLPGQFCTEYFQDDPAGRPRFAESLHVAGARSGRVVTNPIKFKSVCGQAGVSEDGKLYVWGGVAATAARYRNSVVNRAIVVPFAAGVDLGYFSPSGFTGLFQIGSDEDWDFVASPPDSGGADMIIAVKNGGAVWTLGGWQSGVACAWGGLPRVKPQAWRAKLSSAIDAIDSDFTAGYTFGLPVWFTADPQSQPTVRKVRLRKKGAGGVSETDIAFDESEPGQNATVSALYRAKINVGCILSATITSPGSGYTPGGEVTISVEGHEGSGEGAILIAKVGSGGSLESVSVINPGQGYRHPVTATVSGNAVVSVTEPKKVRITDEGEGYKSVPVVSLVPAADEQSDETAGAVAEVSEMSRCGVGEFRVVAGGEGYTFATATEARTGATATAVVNQQGVITGWSLNSPGAQVYSPLDDSPLAVEVAGDGIGAEASAVPAGSRVLAVEVVSNPEVWTRTPTITFTGGEGQGAAAVVEGIIGRLAVSVDNGGAGYTKTAKNWSLAEEGIYVTRTLYSPCAVVAASPGIVIGGRTVGGLVIVGEAVLAPSNVSQISENAAEYCNPHRSPYASYGESVAVSPEDTLKRHRLAFSYMTVESSGVIHPFEQDFAVAEMFTPFTEDDQQIEDYVSQCIRAYVRGPGHQRQPLAVEYVPGSGTEGLRISMVKITLASLMASPQPPSLVLEVLARPHRYPKVVKDIAQSVDFGADESERGCYAPELLDGDEAPGAQEWWASQPGGGDPLNPEVALFNGGRVVATGDSGSSRVYQVVDGRPIPESATHAKGPFPWPNGQEPGGSAAGLTPYLGPVFEIVLSDPCRSWAKPSNAQRIHLLYPTGEDFSARGLAEVVYDDSLLHPVAGPVLIAENGNYTEEPEPMLITGSDPVPVDAGLAGCTSAGFGNDGEAFAVVGESELYWWGMGTSIVNTGVDILPQYTPSPGVDEEDAAEVYADRLRTISAQTDGLTAKPTKTGGHLRFTVSGSHAADAASAMGMGPTAFMRMPRPVYGNRTARLDRVFVPSETRGAYALTAGTHEEGVALFRYRPFGIAAADHGIGYEGSASLEYRGPGESPHTISLSPQVIGNDIVHVGRNGFLQDSQGRWRLPPATRYEDAMALGFTDYPPDIQERTVSIQNLPRPTPCGFGNGLTTAAVYSVTDGRTIALRTFIAAVRTHGSGYRQQPYYDSESWFGRGIGLLTVTGERVSGVILDFGNGNENVNTYTAFRAPYNVTSRVATSSRGGFRTSVSQSLVGEIPPSASAANGTGATVEVFQSPESRFTPFLLWCLDPLSPTVEPHLSGVAAATDGTLRTVRDRLSFTPEAFSTFPTVTAIAVASQYLLFPYLEEGPASCVVRDAAGRLWAVRVGGDDSYVVFSPFLLTLAETEPSRPIAVSPAAIATTATGSGYDYPVSVSVSRPTGVAAGTATIDGRLVGFAVCDGGSGYESPPAVTGEGVSGQSEIAGPVWRIDVTSGGSGYRLPPRVRFSLPGLPADATATVEDGQVRSVTVNAGGMYRQQPPLVSFEPSKDVESISITSGGNGYSTRPVVVIDGGGGSGASASANISCSVVEIILLSQGFGYQTTPTVEIVGDGAGASARAVLDPGSGRIVRIEIANGGANYTKPPTVRIISTGTGGGASAIARIEGYVSSIDVTDRGQGFDRPPTVIITGGGGLGATATATIIGAGSGAAATARINGSVVSVTGAGGGLQRPPAVRCLHSGQPVDGLRRSEAIVKATILGRPTSVSVSNAGTDYYPPYYYPTDTPNKRRTPSTPVRRTMVSAKGSFWFSYYGTRTNYPELFGPYPTTKLRSVYGYSWRHLWLNSFPFLGVAQVSGATADTGGSVSGVELPRVVTRLNVTSPGGNYPPHSLNPVIFKGGGSKDTRFRVWYDNAHTRTFESGDPTLPVRPQNGDLVAWAYAGADGQIIGVVPLIGLGEGQEPVEVPFGLPAGITPYTQPPQFEIQGSGSGSGATVVGELNHPLECYYAPQVIFDGDLEAEADVAITLAGACVEGSGVLPSACLGDGQESPFWSRRLKNAEIDRSKLFQRHVSDTEMQYTTSVSKPLVRLCLSGKVAGFSPRERTQDWTDEDLEFFEKPVGFFAQSQPPPSVAIEDETGTGASITEANIPPSGAISVKWIRDSVINRGGSGYTLAARIRVRGGRPLAWDSPATASATVNARGQVTSVAIQGGGRGYTKPPMVYIVGDGTGAQAEVPKNAINPEDGSISSVRLLSRGSGYTSATVVIVDREVIAEESEAVTEACEFIDRKYSVVLEDCTVERATVPEQDRRQRTTVSARNILENIEMAPPVLDPGDFADLIKIELAAAGYRLHPAYLSDGYVEYVRLEHHFGELPPESPTVTITTNSDVSPATPATAVAVIPECDTVFSRSVANVTKGGDDFPPYQLG